MFDYETIKAELKRIITPESIFVCIGSRKAVFDTFGPICGEILKRKNIPHYGDYNRPMDGVSLKWELFNIYNIDKHVNKNIIAIDACVTSNINKVNNVEVRYNVGIDPGAGVGKNLPRVGKHSIVMYTISTENLRPSVEAYSTFGLGSYVGRRYDLSDRKLIREQAIMVSNIIVEIYNDVCKEKKLI